MVIQFTQRVDFISDELKEYRRGKNNHETGDQGRKRIDKYQQ